MRWRRELTSRSLFTSGMTTARAKPSGRVSAGSEDKIRIRDLWVMSQPVAVSHCSARLTRAGQGLSLVYAVARHPTQSWLLRRVLFTNPFTISHRREPQVSERSSLARRQIRRREDAVYTPLDPHEPLSEVGQDRRNNCQPSAKSLSGITGSQTVKHQPKPHRAEARRAELEPATNGLTRRSIGWFRLLLCSVAAQNDSLSSGSGQNRRFQSIPDHWRRINDD
jgi:hypothetical protein